MRFFLVVLLGSLALGSSAQTLDQFNKTRVKLPNGWDLTPAGKQLQLGDLPLNVVVSKNKNYVAVTNNGQSTQTIQLFDGRKETLLGEIIIPKSWYGLTFSEDEKYLYADGGFDNRIMKYSVSKTGLKLRDSIYITREKTEKIGPGGMALNDKDNKMYVVTKEDSSLYIIDLLTKKVLHKIHLAAEAYTCIFSPDKKQLYITGWGNSHVWMYDVSQGKISKEIIVGNHPNEMCLSKNGQLLFVANSDDNSVSVINTAQWKVIETLNAALFPNAPSGSTSNGVALSADEKILYVANADNNCLAVFNVSKPGTSTSLGFIPTGWYPTNVKTIGNKIWVSNGKGAGSMANPRGPNPLNIKQAVLYQHADTVAAPQVQYIAGLFKGTMSIIPVPTDKLQSVYSQLVYKNTPYTKIKENNPEGEAGNPIPMRVGDPSPIKHVFYIIKENRTYDQVLGDVASGNGDSSLVFFGAHITPNQHKIVNEFVLLDNFYADAEVSADGHNWSMGGYANDYLEKTWPTSYGGRGGQYDAEGYRKLANNRDGFIWDFCKKKGVSYRSYGEFGDRNKANIPALVGHMSPGFDGWNLDIKDTARYREWQTEFDSLMAIKQVPQFNTIRFSNDHTSGMKKGKPTPYAYVADNDYAVGLFLEHLSQSPIWKESVVLILEDDAQNGADHVDAHRSTGYLAGGYVKRHFVDHTMYSTTSFLRTMELILGLPPMTQYDAAATPLWRSFSATPDATPYVALVPNIDLDEKNITLNRWQQMSEGFDFAHEDAVPDLQFNEVLWYGLKGKDAVFPAPRRAAFLKVSKKDKDDDD